MRSGNDVGILVVGAGLAGIATAYYLCTRHNEKSVMLVDSRQPMTFTSAQSGDNYRNWWPHPTMTEFTNYGIDLMEQLANESCNVFNMTRRGYVLATRKREIDDIIAELHEGYQSTDPDFIRIHAGVSAKSYTSADTADWQVAPTGVDVLSDQRLIRLSFPSLGRDIAHVVHIRRAGDISGQQLGQYMLARFRDAGGKRLVAHVRSILVDGQFRVEVEGPNDIESISADVIVNAAGPFAAHLAAMMGVDLPIENVYQQKIAFDDTRAAIPRQLPFSIDLDGFELDWTVEERGLLAEDTKMSWLTGPLPGGVHCRPEGGDKGSWVKLGWAYNDKVSEPLDDLANEPRMDPQYPEIVMRAAMRLNPSLKTYADSFPTRYSHYGGYYPMTPENWPLIGPLGVDGAYVTGALSGFGSMSACAAGAICAAWISDSEMPDYARQLSLTRYADADFMDDLLGARSRGIL